MVSLSRMGVRGWWRNFSYLVSGTKGSQSGEGWSEEGWVLFLRSSFLRLYSLKRAWTVSSI